MNCTESMAWWRNLSNNQMNAVRRKYAPNISYEVFTQGYKWIEDAWTAEGRPEPQELIPVKVSDYTY